MRCIPVFVLFSIALTAAGSACAQSAAPGGEQAFPSRPIRLVSGQRNAEARAPGARIVALQLRDRKIIVAL